MPPSYPSLLSLTVSLSLGLYAASSSSSPTTGNFFTVVGNKIYNAQNESVLFKGIGFTCTEYMMRPIFGPDFWWENCFVGPPPPHYNTSMVLTNETQFVLNYLLPDYMGGNFPTSLPIQKIPFDTPFNQVIDMSTPRQLPIIRIPVTASSYMYDEDANHLGSAGYRLAIDMLVQYYTSNGVAVIIDHHSSCAGNIPCPRSGPMALRNYGSYSGSIAFWDMVCYKYASNPLVMYELYNEPHVWYQAFYGGDPIYAGMAEMLDACRKHTQGLVIIGGHDQYSQDAAGSLAFYLQYVRDHNGTVPSNVIYNLHPYQGVYQGLEHSLRSTMRLVLALKQIGPVIFTEFGQYCCNGGGYETCQKGGGPCKDHEHSDNFVYNMANLAAQYDISFVGWGWRGRNSPSANCTLGQTQCNTPDMRDNSPLDGRTGVLTNGTLGGANWTLVWSTFVNPSDKIIHVQDTLPNVHLNGTAYEPQGYLPRPCIVGQFGLGNYCGYPLGTNMSTLDKDWNSFWNQSVGISVLPGLPPVSTPQECVLQTCPGYDACNISNPIIPMANPCYEK